MADIVDQVLLVGKFIIIIVIFFFFHTQKFHLLVMFRPFTTNFFRLLLFAIMARRCGAVFVTLEAL